MKIICIGRNYAAHAEELHRDAGLTMGAGVAESPAGAAAEPVWFLKPDIARLVGSEMCI